MVARRPGAGARRAPALPDRHGVRRREMWNLDEQVRVRIDPVRGTHPIVAIVISEAMAPG